MKKEGLILLALVLVFGFVVLGCGSTSEIPLNGGGGEEPGEGETWPEVVKTVSEATLTLTNNAYGDGAQLTLKDASEKYFPRVITKGEEYVINIKFQADRVPTSKLQFDLVCTCGDEACPTGSQYWGNLAGDEIAEVEITASGTDIEAEIKFTVDTTAKDLAGSTLAIQTEEPEDPTDDLILTIATFTITRLAKE